MPPCPMRFSIWYSPIIVPGSRSPPAGAGAATALPTVTTGGSVIALTPWTSVSSSPVFTEGVSVEPSVGQTFVPNGHCFPHPPQTGMLDYHITILELSDRLIQTENS